MDTPCLIHHAETGSTMDDARQQAQALIAASVAGDPMAHRRLAAGLLITATRQTKGRGTQGRPWASPHGALMGTYLRLIPAAPSPATLGTISLRIALHLAECVQSWINPAPNGPLRVQIKWPNDLLIQSRKLAGVLTECFDTPAAPTTNTPPAFILLVGVGINANNAPPSLPPHERPATTLAHYRSSPLDLNEAARTLASVLSEATASSAHPLTEHELARLDSRLFGCNHPATITPDRSTPPLPNAIIAGINPDGTLRVTSGGQALSIARSTQVHWPAIA